jgi:Histone deacetylase complex, SIN3 component
MQPVGPYRFIEAISVCQVGSVWSAIDGQGNSFSAAVLDAAAAADQRWRDAFAGTAHALAAGGTRFVHADLTASAPWVLYPGADGASAEQLFRALGMECRPLSPTVSGDESVTVKSPTTGTTPPAESPADAPADVAPASPSHEESVDQAPRPTPETTAAGPWQTGPHRPVVPQQSHAPDPVSAPPHQVSVPPHQTSAPPHQVSVPPHQTSAPPLPLPEMPGAYPSSAPPASDPSYDPLYSPVRHIVPSEPKPRRARMWLVIGAAAVVMLLAVGGTVFALTNDGEPSPPTATQTTGTPLPAPPPTNPPLQPGLEPPTPGSWPTNWPNYNERDDVRTYPNLDGLGFPLKVPSNWECNLAGRAEGYAKYVCGVPDGAGPKYGGELIVRDCPQPCDETQQITMRRAEEAWGVRWIRTGPRTTLAETTAIEENGEPRHGLIVIAFFSSGNNDGVVDRQLVLRLTAPRDGAFVIRRVATYLRNTLIF